MFKAIQDLPVSFTMYLSPAFKKTIITTSTSISVIGIASGILNQQPVMTGCAVLWGVTNFIAWLDLGASELLKGYKEGFQTGVKKEQEESQTIKDLLQDLEDIKKSREDFQETAKKMLEMNNLLESSLREANQTIEELKDVEKGSSSTIKVLQKELSSQESKIVALMNQEGQLQEQIQNSKRSMEDAALLITEQMQTISKLNRQIKDFREGRR